MKDYRSHARDPHEPNAFTISMLRVPLQDAWLELQTIQVIVVHTAYFSIYFQETQPHMAVGIALKISLKSQFY